MRRRRTRRASAGAHAFGRRARRSRRRRCEGRAAHRARRFGPSCPRRTSRPSRGATVRARCCAAQAAARLVPGRRLRMRRTAGSVRRVSSCSASSTRPSAARAASKSSGSRGARSTRGVDRSGTSFESSGGRRCRASHSPPAAARRRARRPARTRGRSCPSARFSKRASAVVPDRWQPATRIASA